MDIEKIFEEFGLSLYQAKVLAALIQYGEAKASDISQLSGVPRAKVYFILDQLVNLGLVDKKLERPIRYKSKSPEDVVERLKYNIGIEYKNRLKKIEGIECEFIDLLKELYKPSEIESKELIKVIRVGEPSERETRLMYLGAEKEIDILSKVFEYYHRVRKELIDALDRDVEIRIILLGKEFLSGYSKKVQEEILKSLKKDVKAKIRLSKTVLPLRGTIIDPSYEYKTGKAIFVVEDPKTPLYLRDAAITENPSLVAGMKKYFDLIWKYESERLTE
jgi:sugar-specific transcriptional regulator TrmB